MKLFWKIIDKIRKRKNIVFNFIFNNKIWKIIVYKNKMGFYLSCGFIKYKILFDSLESKKLPKYLPEKLYNFLLKKENEYFTNWQILKIYYQGIGHKNFNLNIEMPDYRKLNQKKYKSGLTLYDWYLSKKIGINYMKFSEILSEEQNAGEYVSNGGTWEVEVYDNEGNLPHAHVISPRGEVAAPRLDAENYFIHEGKDYIFNSKERKDFERFMNKQSSKSDQLTNWQFCVFIWNRNKIHKISMDMNKKPNHRNLPSA